ncbi:ATP synthase subunit gamma, mitochondrial-like [Sitodiplosis mosellana]|uniref:ATP synthase subunit gamma, mitochondrial-like n=1 Tax=Sitodiplosis mosellana TaxID=263140 RepID=UPI00244446FE|nr:ATP synthase subunit gamma, mitochondrial-like [Sitodiplosis mosellana]
MMWMQKVTGAAPAVNAIIANSLYAQQSRNMATLKAISMRLKSVKNIQKITQSMKMVSAAKYARAERDLKQARPFGEGAKKFYEVAEVKAPTDNAKELLVAITSDRGLCGAVHTGVARSIRNDLQSRTGSTENTKIACVGDKSRAILQRLFADKFVFVANEIGRTPPTFLDASGVAKNILQSNFDFSHGSIVYNKFKSVVSYSCSTIPIFSVKAVESSENIAVYDSLDSDVLNDYLEYSLASLIYYTMKESACSEQSSRMTAMDNASKNAGEMIDKLTLTFNRTRQAVITRELIEIISGAAALN